MAKKGFLDGYPTYNTSDGYGNASKWREAFRQRFTKEQATEILQQQPETPYSILGVTADATPKAIKKAFRRLITEWHPDKNQHRLAEAETMSKKIIVAYTVLSS